MGKYMITTILVTLFFFRRYALAKEASSTTKQYIVYMGEHSFSDSNSVISSNHDLLASVTGSVGLAKEVTTHHYHKSFRGFAAALTPGQAQNLRETKSVISVFESQIHRLHTTHSWEFLKIDDIPQNNEQIKMNPKSDVIVGVIDTGIWPESKSFNDKGLGPVPKRFKGECAAGDQDLQFTCNRKIIGARFYTEGYVQLQKLGLAGALYPSPRDDQGHGTHTASTIAGSVVNNVSLFGIASGDARGGMPTARLAMYKVCWPVPGGCPDADVLSAFDDAIRDGVDIISLSLGTLLPKSQNPIEGLFNDAFAIGSFHAFKNGILVSGSAGNTGTYGSIVNSAPWILTVAASTINREFNSYVRLGNYTMSLRGSSINLSKEMDKYYGIINATDAAAGGDVPQESATYCYPNSLDHTLIKGKIVVCTAETIDYNMKEPRISKSEVVRKGNAAGMILVDPLLGSDLGDQHGIPTTILEPKQIDILREYLKIEKNPSAKILPTITEVDNTIHAPNMASFSSRGPNLMFPDIIKPDITAPGVKILAAWSPASPTLRGATDYNILSGTSMSCPHVSALAAIIKSYHPSWTPAAIKSAIMTTATVMDKMLKNPDGSPTSPFDYGSGHINIVAALDPGLVYDFDTTDMIKFLCSSGAPNLVACEKPDVPTYDLNYPSICVANMTTNVSVKRTVTYYGHGPTVFKASMGSPHGVKATVTPDILKFKEAGEKRSFRVHFTPGRISEDEVAFGSLTWTGGKYTIRSPILIGHIAAATV